MNFGFLYTSNYWQFNKVTIVIYVFIVFIVDIWVTLPCLY